MKCLNTVVFYENRDEVKAYVKEAASLFSGLLDIIVVVNSDRDRQVPKLAEEWKAEGIAGVHVIDYGDNVGYLNALLKPVQSVDLGAYDYYILSNTDIHYDTKDFFQKLLSAEYAPDVGCIAPSVYASISDSYSNPHYLQRIPKEKLKRRIRIFRHPALAGFYLRLADWKAARVKSGKQPSCYVYSPHGCYMIFTREFIRRIRGYEYGVKMYSEESAVGELLRHNQMRCYYDDTISVIHQESSVTGKINQAKRFAAWRESLEYILKAFY